jgi:hypothetical protein
MLLILLGLTSFGTMFGISRVLSDLKMFSSKKILRLSAYIHSSFKMSETIVDVVMQLR